MKCNQKNCEERAIFTVYWPGSSPPPSMCGPHTEKALGVAEAMGLTLHIDPIYYEDTKDD